MRATLRLLANVGSAAKYLEAGTPTGLTGLHTHPSPRSTLLYLYTSTLDKLKAAPEHSVYRQSVEALTRHRLAIVEAAVPPGYEQWAERARRLLREHPERFKVRTPARLTGADAKRVEIGGGQAFVLREVPPEVDMRDQEWDGEVDEGPELEGSRTLEERQDLRLIFERTDLGGTDQVQWEPEPQLTADQ